ncbi:MAG: fused MFS/spermidine synthase [Deltaproteobacteria bacterium]|nr:fused MFS/spermidine synthase [Deltaproteobacteria bacterium]
MKAPLQTKVASDRSIRWLFFVSGGCSLVYEVLWAKSLHTMVGCSLHAVALVMAAFMSGLALGSVFGGWLARRQPNGLRVYAFLEAGIGLFALLTPLVFAGLSAVYVALHGLLEPSPHLGHALRFLLCFLGLVAPAVLMGATLPVLTQYLDRARPGLGRNLGHLYGFNTLGAVLGCFGAGFFLLPTFGIAWTVRGAALANLLVAALALLIDKAAPAPAALSGRDGLAAPPAEAKPTWRKGLLLAAFALSGFFSLGYEVLWTKAIAFFISNSAYAFSAMLTTFLFGLGLGGVLVARFADRLERPWFGFGLIQVLIGLAAAASIVIFAKFSYPDRFDNSSASPLWFKFAYSFLVMFVPTVLMGLLLPLAGRILVRSTATAGRDVGTLYALNTLGCMAGAAVAGFALIPLLGIPKSILLLCGLQALLGLVLITSAPELSRRRRYVWAGAVAGAFLAFVYVAPVQGKLYSSAGRSGMPKSQSIYYREGAASIVEVLETPDRNRYLIINGSINAAPYPESVGLRAHRLISQLPLLLHSDPRRLLLVGLGSGMTAGAALAFDGVETIDCAELSRDVAGATDYFERWNHGVARSSKLDLTFEDGRNHMLTSPGTYDVVTLESIHPKWDAGNASLYSRDFYRLCKRRLNPGGFISQWAPLNGLTFEEFRTILKTFSEEFPHSSLWFARPTGYLAATNAILLGSQRPVHVDVDRLLAAFADADLARDLKEEGVDDAIELLDGFIMAGETLRRFAGQDVPANTDDLPILEYGPVVNRYEQILAALASVRSSVRPYCRPPVSTKDSETFFAELQNRFEVSQLSIQGDLAHLRGDHNRAIASYGDALLMDPGNRDTAEEYANVQFKGNYQFMVAFDKAKSWRPEEIHRFLRIMFHRDDKDAVLWTGRQYQMAGWHDAARVHYRQALALDPENADAAASLRDL